MIPNFLNFFKFYSNNSNEFDQLKDQIQHAQWELTEAESKYNKAFVNARNAQIQAIFHNNQSYLKLNLFTQKLLDYKKSVFNGIYFKSLIPKSEEIYELKMSQLIENVEKIRSKMNISPCNIQFQNRFFTNKLEMIENLLPKVNHILTKLLIKKIKMLSKEENSFERLKEITINIEDIFGSFNQLMLDILKNHQGKEFYSIFEKELLIPYRIAYNSAIEAYQNYINKINQEEQHLSNYQMKILRQQNSKEEMSLSITQIGSYVKKIFIRELSIQNAKESLDHAREEKDIAFTNASEKINIAYKELEILIKKLQNYKKTSYDGVLFDNLIPNQEICDEKQLLKFSKLIREVEELDKVAIEDLELEILPYIHELLVYLFIKKINFLTKQINELVIETSNSINGEKTYETLFNKRKEIAKNIDDIFQSFRNSVYQIVGDQFQPNLNIMIIKCEESLYSPYKQAAQIALKSFNEFCDKKRLEIEAKTNYERKKDDFLKIKEVLIEKYENYQQTNESL